MKKLEIRDACRANFNKYTRQAFNAIPAMENPEILDLGCGTGIPTIEIASLTNGKILAVDTDRKSLEWLQKKISNLNLKSKITILNDSVLNLRLAEKSFDLIIAEGILNVIGFNKGLSKFTGFLKTYGHFMIHDEYEGRDRKLKLFEKHGVSLIKSFVLDERVWWDEYYSCLERKIKKVENVNPDETHLLNLFKQEKSEITRYKSNPMEFRSTYYVLQKR